MADISRVPKTLDLELYAGDGIAIRYTSVKTDDTPFPLDGLVASQIKAKRTDLEPLAEWAVDDSGKADGVVILSLTGEQTASLIPIGKSKFSGVWDLQFSPDGAEPVTFLQGKVTCDADVTR